MTAVDLDGLRVGARALGVALDDAQIDRFSRYADGLGAWNERVNLTSAQALADITRTHFLDSLTLVPFVTRAAGDGARVVDVGSGAGFPGVALKVAMPSLRVTLVEATAKKAVFLRWLVDELALTGVEVRTGRAEELGHDVGLRESFDIATARALGPMTTMLELTLPFVRVGGVLLAQRGKEAGAEAGAAMTAAEALGASIRETQAVHGGPAQAVADGPAQAIEGGPAPAVADGPAQAIEGGPDGGERYVVVVAKTAPTPERYPRRTGVPAKRPL